MKFKTLLLGISALTLLTSFGVQAAQKIRIGTEPTFAPFEFTTDQGEELGFDIDIIRAIAVNQGLELEIVNMPFDGLIPALMTSQIDAAIAGVTITEERRKKVDFTDPYYESSLSLVILKDNVGKYQKVDDLKGKKICGQIGNTGAAWAAEHLTDPSNVKNFNTHPEAFMELKNSGCEAVMTDRPVNEYFLVQDGSGAFVEIPDFVDAAQMGIAVRKSNKEILQKLNEGLRQIKKDGTFSQIHQKWFGGAE